MNDSVWKRCSGWCVPAFQVAAGKMLADGNTGCGGTGWVGAAPPGGQLGLRNTALADD